MNIAALFADITDGTGVSPIKVKKACHGCIELSFLPPKAVRLTDQTN